MPPSEARAFLRTCAAPLSYPAPPPEEHVARSDNNRCKDKAVELNVSNETPSGPSSTSASATAFLTNELATRSHAAYRLRPRHSQCEPLPLLGLPTTVTSNYNSNDNARLATEHRNKAHEDDGYARKGLPDPSIVRCLSGSRFYAFLSQSYSRPLGGVHIHPNNSGTGPGAEGGEEEHSKQLEDVQSAVSVDLFETNHWA
jgi:hypothetical protein